MPANPLLWHAYPRIGLDERNQFDFYRDAPGGLDGLRRLARDFQGRGVRVYIDYNPWDTRTRREGIPDLDALAHMVRALGADGIFLDTMKKGGAEFRRRLDAVRPGVVLEGELDFPSKTCTIITCHGRRGSPTPGFRECCETNGSSVATCSIRFAAGTAITPPNCTRRG